MPHYKRDYVKRFKTGGKENTPTRFGSWFSQTWILDKFEQKPPFYLKEYKNGYPSPEEIKRLDEMKKK